MNNRYTNLLLGANSLRFSGAILKLLGLAIAIVIPIVAAAASLTADGDPGAVTSLNKYTPWWPLIITVFAMPVGVQFYVRGITQASYGEAFVALADIAVATGATAPREIMVGWARERGLGSFVLQLMAVGMAMVAIPAFSGIAANKAETKARIDTDCKRCVVEHQECLQQGSEDDCKKILFACQSTSGISSFDCARHDLSTWSNVSKSTNPSSSSADAVSATTIVPGAAVEFVVSNTDAVWDGESLVAPLFGGNAGRKRFRMGASSTPDGAPFTVFAVHGTFFSTTDAPLSYAPLDAAKVVRKKGLLEEQP